MLWNVVGDVKMRKYAREVMQMPSANSGFSYVAVFRNYSLATLRRSPRDVTEQTLPVFEVPV